MMSRQLVSKSGKYSEALKISSEGQDAEPGQKNYMR